MLVCIDLGSAAGGGISYRCNGNLRAVNDGSRTSGHANFTSGSLVRMILDFDTQMVELSVNGLTQGNYAFATAGLANSALYPAVSTHDDGEAVRLTAPEPLPPITSVPYAMPPLQSPSPFYAPPPPPQPSQPPQSGGYALPNGLPHVSPPLSSGGSSSGSLNNGVMMVLKQPTGFPSTRQQLLMTDIRRLTLPLNILIMGVAGGAKSTLINTLYTSMLAPHEPIRTPAFSIATAGHASTDLRKYRLPNSNISLWDPWYRLLAHTTDNLH
jgi:hypothetical protein